MCRPTQKKELFLPKLQYIGYQKSKSLTELNAIINRYLYLYLAFCLVLTQAEIVGAQPLTPPMPHDAQQASQTPAETTDAKQITKQSKQQADQALLLNPPSLYAPHEYEPKIKVVSAKQGSLKALVKNQSKEKPLKVEIDLPSYVYGDLVFRFNSAMVSPIDIGLSPKFDISITPKIEGKFVWQGPQSIRFSPKERWKYATQYKVKLKGPMTSIKGQSLGPYFETSRHFSTDRNEVSNISLYEDGSWSSYLDQKSIIQICLEQKQKGSFPLSKLHLYKIEGRRILKSLTLAYALNQEIPHTYYDKDRCSYFKIIDQVEPFSTYRIEVDKGINSEEGPLLSEKGEWRDFESERQLTLEQLKIYRHYIQLRFNHKVPSALVYDHVLLYPVGLDPNTIKAEERQKHSFLRPKSDEKHQQGRTWSVELYHNTAPTKELAVWMRVKHIKSSEHNGLKRTQVFKEFWKDKQDSGQEWLLLKTAHPDLGRIDYNYFSSFISVEQLNQPAFHLRHYAMDHMCLRWHALSPKQIAQFDLMERLEDKDLKDLSLPTVGEELCANVFDANYVSKKQKFPLVPYRYALAGEPKDWSFTEEASQTNATLPNTGSQLTGPKALGPSTKVQPNCADKSNPCAIQSAFKNNFYKWANSLPSLKPGSGPQFYLLNQKWHWQPKEEDISPEGWLGARSLAPNKHRYFQNTSLIQATRYGLIGKLGELGGQVWIWDLESKQAVGQAKVSVYVSGGTKVADVLSNQDGIAEFKFNQKQIQKLKAATKKKSLNYYIMANVREDYAFVSSTNEHRVRDKDHHYGYYYYYYDDYDDGKYVLKRGLVWSDRAIYRPGDDVFVAGTLAEVTTQGVLPLRETNCQLNFTEHYGKTLEEVNFKTSKLGGFSHKLTLDKDAGLGTYSASVSCKSPQDPKKSYTWSHDVRIAHFERPTFKVDALAKNNSLSQQALDLGVRAEYFYGAGLNERKWHSVVTTTKGSYSPSVELKYQRAEDPQGIQLGVAKLGEFIFGGLHQLDWDHRGLHSEIQRFFPSFTSDSGLELNGSDSRSGRLDQNGYTTIQFRPTINGYTPYELSAQWTVSDSDQASLSAGSQVVIHPSSSYIGLRSTQGHYVPSNQEHTVEVVLVDPLQDRFAQGQDVELSLFQIQWVKIASSDEIGRDEVQNQQKLVKVGSCQLKQVSQPQTCTQTPVKSGEHLWVAHSTNAKGEESYSILSSYVYGSYGSWAEAEGNKLKLRLGTHNPKIGEELSMLIENPFPEAEVWITVERETIVYSKRQKVGPADLIKIPITEEMGPNAWVKVALTQPRSSLPYVKSSTNPAPFQSAKKHSYEDDDQVSDLGQAREFYGSEEIQVRLSEAELKVTVTPDAQEKRPGDSITVQVKVSDQQNQAVAGEVYLWALDESVVRLTDFKAPNLFDMLHNDRKNRIDTYSHLTQMIAHATMGNKGYPVGGGGGEGDLGVNGRSNFKATPFFLGVQKVDPSGQVSFTQKLSDDLTTFKLFAVAVSERQTQTTNGQQNPPKSKGQLPYLLRAGSGSSKVTVNLPLMLKAVLPRSLNVGDRFNMGAMISSLMDSDETLKVKFELEGPVEALGITETESLVPRRKNKVVSVPYKVTGLGKVKVNLTLYRNGKVEDRVEHELEAQVPAAPEHFAQVGELVALPKGQEETAVIDLRQSTSKEDGQDQLGVVLPTLPAQIQLDFGVSVINNLFNDVVALIEYPYGCLEQRSSRILPFALAQVLKLPLEEVFNRKDHSIPSDQRLKKVIQSYFNDVASMQNHSGGIRYWMSFNAKINLWSNIYAFVVINELVKAGYKNDMVNMKSLQRFLKLSRPHGFKLKNRGEYNVRPELSAFLSFAQSEYATPDYALEEELYSMSEDLNLNAKLLLAASMAGPITKPSKGARLTAAKALFKDAMRSFSFDGERVQLADRNYAWAWWSFDSSRRKLALALMAMLRVEPEHELALPLLRTIAQKTKGRQYLNTQATAFTLLAIRDYLAVRESVTPDMHVNVEMLVNQAGQRSKTTLSTHDIKGFDSPLISVKRKFNLKGVVQGKSKQHMMETEGIGISATGQGRLYYGARITQYPQVVQKESINRGYILEREYRLKLPANTSDAQRRKLFSQKADDQDPDLFPKTLSYQLGDLVEVTLTLKVPHEAHYLVINDALPSGLEIVDQSLKGSQFYGPAKGSEWHVFDHVELRDDRVLLFANRLRKGTYQFKYITKASTVGRFMRPAAVVEEMYAPQHFGRSDGGYLWVGSAP